MLTQLDAVNYRLPLNAAYIPPRQIWSINVHMQFEYHLVKSTEKCNRISYVLL